MHDPMVVAFEVPSPVPKRDRWRDKYYKGRRWGWTRRRRTNQENLGEPVYRWWRPAGWEFALGGRVWSWRTLATVWHVEPGGRDAFEVCKHASRWKWHVHHWKIQMHSFARAKSWLFDRCDHCGRRFAWGETRFGYMSSDAVYHEPCQNLRQVRSQLDDLSAYVQGDADDTQRWRVEHRLERKESQ